MHIDADNSAHCTLSYTDAKQVIEKGWGERHPLDGSLLLGYGYMMVVSPGDVSGSEESDHWFLTRHN